MYVVIVTNTSHLRWENVYQSLVYVYALVAYRWAGIKGLDEIGSLVLVVRGEVCLKFSAVSFAENGGGTRELWADGLGLSGSISMELSYLSCVVLVAA
jgi:hypothetical protein